MRTLYGPTGQVNIREERTAADAADWSPANTVDEDAGDVIFASREWEEVRAVAYFNGTVGGSETVTVQPIREMRAPDGSKFWIDLPEVVLAGQGGTDMVLTDGARVAFRISALTLGTADSVTLILTGGNYSRET